MNATTLSSAEAYQRAVSRLVLRASDCAGGGPLGTEAWQTYRGIVRARFAETIEHAFPRLCTLAGQAAVRRAEDLFLDAAPPRTPILRLVPGEFVAFLGKANATESLPTWAYDLARYEWSELCAAYAEDDDPKGIVPLAMDRPLALSRSCHILRLAYAVHRISREDPSGPIEPAETHLLVYRDPRTFDVHTLELSPSAAMLFDASMASDKSLAEAARLASEGTGATCNAPWVEAFAALLADFVSRGIVLGSRSATSEAPAIGCAGSEC